ncbi:MAG: type II toxin-antitoxin system RelE/ParE family toxin [Oscillospiraceae bacterium]|jgi:mRNA interferase RelE/StbE|nr:type II toxin-antitoxin system RelE/ParE family toxin [Oscillospiraceae bacterium]
MNYHVVLSDPAKKMLKKLDPSVSRVITRWLRKNLEGTSNPRQHGKALTENLTGKWRYRIGDYRLIADISDDTVTILVLKVGHRGEIYAS